MPRKMVKYLVMFLLLGCASPVKYHRHQLYRQRLVVRKAYPGKLTNQVCENYKGKVCEKWNVLEYDMNDPKFRKKANDFRIVCQIGGKRWRICIEKAGFCRKICTRINKYSLKCYKHEDLFISSSDHEFLYDAGTVCKTYLTGGK